MAPPGAYALARGAAPIVSPFCIAMLPASLAWVGGTMTGRDRPRRRVASRRAS